MQLATKTLQAIEEALTKDQGAAFRGHLATLMPLAGDAYRTDEDDWRDHLGASLIGRECSRELWYSFRWATRKRFEGRMIRLFNRGHLEEPRFVAMLLTIGCEVWQVTAEGKQWRIDGYRKHGGGSLDGVARGCPDLPADEPFLTEYKTHNDKSFAKLVAEGVLKAKWEHFVQMQIYMGKYNLRYALYCAVNKNDDSLHIEVVQFDPTIYERYNTRFALIIDSPSAPPKISQSPGWFKCKFCDHKDVCHGSARPEKTCRTCKHIVIADAGEWYCCRPVEPIGEGLGERLTPAKQREGCDYYEMNPSVKQ